MSIGKKSGKAVERGAPAAAPAAVPLVLSTKSALGDVIAEGQRRQWAHIEVQMCELATVLYEIEKDFNAAGERRTLKRIGSLLEKAAEELSTLDAAGPGRAWAPMLEGIRQQREAARASAAAIPDPRRALTLTTMAEVYVLTSQAFYQRSPTLSNSSEDVARFGRVCHSAGIVLSKERLRGALSVALDAVRNGTSSSRGHFEMLRVMCYQFVAG